MHGNDRGERRTRTGANKNSPLEARGLNVNALDSSVSRSNIVLSGSNAMQIGYRQAERVSD